MSKAEIPASVAEGNIYFDYDGRKCQDKVEEIMSRVQLVKEATSSWSKDAVICSCDEKWSDETQEQRDGHDGDLVCFRVFFRGHCLCFQSREYEG